MRNAFCIGALLASITLNAHADDSELLKQMARLEAALKKFTDERAQLVAEIAKEVVAKHNLKGDKGEQGPPGVVPPGVVVASTVRCDDTRLGGGWEELPGSAGRFVIGAGQATTEQGKPAYLPYDKAGRPNVTLTDNEMPTHDHGLIARPTVPSNITGGYSEDPSRRVVASEKHYNSESVGTFSAGKGMSFDILPPYIALYWCKKS